MESIIVYKTKDAQYGAQETKFQRKVGEVIPGGKTIIRVVAKTQSNVKFLNRVFALARQLSAGQYRTTASVHLGFGVNFPTAGVTRTWKSDDDRQKWVESNINKL